MLPLILPSTLFAQSYQEQKDSLFQHLDKNKISTGVLYDRVYPWAGLSEQKEDDFLVSFSFMKQAWLELTLASYENESLLSVEDLKDKILKNTLEDKGITLGYLDFEFNSIDTQALDRGSLYLGEDSLVYDGEGNPYHLHHITYPLVSRQTLQGDYAKFYFDPEIHLSNTGRSIERISITLSNNRNKVFFPNDVDSFFIGDMEDSVILASIDIYFVGDRTPESSSMAWWNGNNTLYSSAFNEDKCVFKDDTWSGPDLKFQGYDENIPSQGKGNYRIFYRKLNGSWNVCANNIKKPVIIIDGFDPGDKRGIIAEESEDESIWDMLKFKKQNDTLTLHLGDSLRTLGYDVIVLNFPQYTINGINRDGGSDYIERNAMVLVKLIQEVNQELINSGSNEEITIIGPSMGGQIARYALTYMEADSTMNHNTRLYVSFDSPHLGANIPIAAQQALYHLGEILNLDNARDSYQGQIRSKAARQMLIEQMDGLNKTSNFFLNYYANLYTNGIAGNEGWPVNLRKVALINGNAKGIETNGAKEQIVHLEANTALGFKGIELDLYNMPKFGDSLLTYKGMMKNLEFDFFPFPLSFQSYSNPYNTLYLYAYYNNFSIPTGANTSLWTYKSEMSVINNNQNGVMDIVPGGTYHTIKELRTQIHDTLDSMTVISSIEWKNMRYEHSFIPSVSALAFKDSDFNWSNPFYNRSLVCNNEIPFDNYFTAQKNEKHIFISPEAAEWVLEEIEKGQMDCPTICASTNKVENDLNTALCINEERYIFHNLDVPSNYVVSWYLDDTTISIEIIDSDHYKVKVRGIYEDQNVNIYLKIINPCGADIKRTYTFKSIGLYPGGLRVYPENPIIIGGTPINNLVKIENYEPAGNDYYWRLGEQGAWVLATSEHSPYGTFAIDSTLQSSIRIYLKTVNNCGEYIEMTNPSAPSVALSAKFELGSTIAYPNPSTGNWNVQFKNLSDKQLFLYDYLGRLIWQSSVTGLNAVVPGQKLTIGVYLLKIQSKEEESTIKLMKQ